jgi:N-acetylmuramoyl-L-alanine amidase
LGAPQTDPDRRVAGTGLRGALVGVAVLTATVLSVQLIGAASVSARKVAHRRHPSSAAAARSAALSTSKGTALDPAQFTSGSCVAFAPLSGNRHKTVFLDAGHGGLDPGGIGETESGQTIYEADQTLPVELDTMALLRADGFRVVVSRTGDATVGRIEPGDVSDGVFTVQGAHDDVAARDICANIARANVLIGIYFDVGPSAENAGSITAYDAARPFAAANMRIASLVQSDVLAAMNAQGWGIPDDGAVSDVSLGGPALSSEAAAYGHLLLLGPASPGYFDTPSSMPGALIEPLFITDPFEGSIAASSAGQHTIAQGIAQAVEQYFAPAAPAPTASTTTTTAVATAART